MENGRKTLLNFGFVHFFFLFFLFSVTQTNTRIVEYDERNRQRRRCWWNVNDFVTYEMIFEHNCPMAIVVLHSFTFSSNNCILTMSNFQRNTFATFDIHTNTAANSCHLSFSSFVCFFFSFVNEWKWTGCTLNLRIHTNQWTFPTYQRKKCNRRLSTLHSGSVRGQCKAIKILTKYFVE